MIGLQDLRQVPLFASLTKADLQNLLPLVVERRYRKGEAVFHMDDPGHTLFCLRSGRVKVHTRRQSGEEVVYAILGAGQYFGELSLLDGDPRSASVTALEKTEVLVLHREDFLSCLGSHPGVAISLLQVLAQRLRQADELIEMHASLDVYGRVLKILLGHLERQRSRATGDQPLVLSLTQGDLAAEVGASRESVNKVLADYRKKGYIAIERGRIIVLRQDMLAEVLSRRWR